MSVDSSLPPSFLVYTRGCECIHEDVLQPPIAPDLSTFLRMDHLEMPGCIPWLEGRRNYAYFPLFGVEYGHNISRLLLALMQIAPLPLAAKYGGSRILFSKTLFSFFTNISLKSAQIFDVVREPVQYHM
jgi:hypothetical protein